MPITTVHNHTTTPVGATAVGRRHPRETSHPTTVPVRNGHAVTAMPVTLRPSSWLRRPTAQNTQHTDDIHREPGRPLEPKHAGRLPGRCLTMAG